MDIILLPGLWLPATIWDAVADRAAGARPPTGPVALPGVDDGVADRTCSTTSSPPRSPPSMLPTGRSSSATRRASTLAWLVADRRPEAVAGVVMVGGFPSAPGAAYADFFPVVDGVMAFPGWEPFDGPDTADLDDAPLVTGSPASPCPCPAASPRATVRLLDERRFAVPVTLVCPEFDPDAGPRLDRRPATSPSWPGPSASRSSTSTAATGRWSRARSSWPACSTRPRPGDRGGAWRSPSSARCRDLGPVRRTGRAQQRDLRRLLVHRLPPRGPASAASTSGRSSRIGCSRATPTPRWSSTTRASPRAGASRQPRELPTIKHKRVYLAGPAPAARLAHHLLLGRPEASWPGRCPRRTRRGPRTDRRPRRWPRRGDPRGDRRTRGARPFPVHRDRRAVRGVRLRTAAPGRQARLDRQPHRRTTSVASLRASVPHGRRVPRPGAGRRRRGPARRVGDHGRRDPGRDGASPPRLRPRPTPALRGRRAHAGRRRAPRPHARLAGRDRDQEHRVVPQRQVARGDVAGSRCHQGSTHAGPPRSRRSRRHAEVRVHRCARRAGTGVGARDRSTRRSGCAGQEAAVVPRRRDHQPRHPDGRDQGRACHGPADAGRPRRRRRRRGALLRSCRERAR